MKYLLFSDFPTRVHDTSSEARKDQERKKLIRDSTRPLRAKQDARRSVVQTASAANIPLPF